MPNTLPFLIVIPTEGFSPSGGTCFSFEGQEKNARSLPFSIAGTADFVEADAIQSRRAASAHSQVGTARGQNEGGLAETGRGASHDGIIARGRGTLAQRDIPHIRKGGERVGHSAQSTHNRRRLSQPGAY